jgi:hypothetical protein
MHHFDVSALLTGICAACCRKMCTWVYKKQPPDLSTPCQLHNAAAAAAAERLVSNAKRAAGLASTLPH